jgi:hypothetical protein
LVVRKGEGSVGDRGQGGWTGRLENGWRKRGNVERMGDRWDSMIPWNMNKIKILL